MQELAPLINVGFLVSGLDLLGAGGLRFGIGSVDQLEDEGPSGYDSGTSWQAVPTLDSLHPQTAVYVQIPSDDVFQHRTLPARLRSYDNDLGEIYGVLHLR